MSTSDNNVVRVDALSFSFNVSYMRELSQWHEFKTVSGYNGALPEFPKSPAQIDFGTGLMLVVEDHQHHFLLKLRS
ncbi:hypothetical protein [Yokenella regensburgei]|uniref:hypothetical protein n=1 Tax=Yokenella regensburgei TaxID=158877 RepID=UPI003ED9B164